MRWGLAIAASCGMFWCAPAEADLIMLSTGIYPVVPVTGTVTHYFCTSATVCSDTSASISRLTYLNATVDLATLLDGPVSVTQYALLCCSAGPSGYTQAMYDVRYTGADANGYATFEAYNILIEGSDNEPTCRAAWSIGLSCDYLTWTLTGRPFALMSDTPIPAPPESVPEPATWAMMLLGFGAIAFTLRRGKRHELAAT